MSSWEKLQTVIRLRRAENRSFYFWLRDDDAYQSTPELERLLNLSETFSIPVALSVIPYKLEESLPALLKNRPQCTVIQHGFQHHNYGKGTGLSGEFQEHRHLSKMVEDLQLGKRILEKQFGSQFLPVFVPPWNQIAESVIHELPKYNYVGMSRFGTETQSYVLKIQNCQLDLLKWKPKAHFAGREKCLNILCEALESKNTYIGLLTHHQDHDPEANVFFDELLQFLKKENCHWKSVSEVFQ